MHLRRIKTNNAEGNIVSSIEQKFFRYLNDHMLQNYFNTRKQMSDELGLAYKRLVQL